MLAGGKIQVGQDIFEICADEKDLPILERQFCGHTKLDKEIERLAVPMKPLWLNIVIRIIRFYQKKISLKLGNRCVFDPSCSHYAEMAFRKKGFMQGLQLVARRLHRCRPGNGGSDPVL